MFRKLTGHSYSLFIPKEGELLHLVAGIPHSISSIQHQASKTFIFLNQSHTFKEAMNWNFSKYGKLWAYNLNYFEYLHQPEMSEEQGLELIRDFIDQIEDNHEGLEPYPISLRGISWITFLSRHEIEDPKINATLYAQYQILLDNLEYHLLGNHLLENGCSLLFGAYYFQDQELYKAAEQILHEQLEEQILEDGGHFERSTMYQCILLERLLDCYNVVRGSEWVKNEELENLLSSKVELMLSWLRQMTVDGRPNTDDRRSSSVTRQLPLLNDAAKGVGPSVSQILNYANRLELQSKQIKLGESGYRKYSTEKLDLICDVGAVGPDYQPGHAHSDTFSFILYANGKPVIIDPGISTYENDNQRQLERSTEFHNTVQVENREQSEVWSAFRVGRRAHVKIESENDTELIARHDGYKQLGIIHQREWVVEEDCISIEDHLVGQKNTLGTFYLHFNPGLLHNISVEGDRIITDAVKIQFDSADRIRKYSYHCPDGYNQYIKAPKIEVSFVNYLKTIIILKGKN